MRRKFSGITLKMGKCEITLVEEAWNFLHVASMLAGKFFRRNMENLDSMYEKILRNIHTT